MSTLTKEEAQAKLDEMRATVQAGIDHLVTFASIHGLAFNLDVKSQYYDTTYTAHVERTTRGEVEAWVSSTYEYPDWNSSDC